MHTVYVSVDADARRRRRRRLIAFAPLFLVGGIGLFFGVGYLVVWLWRVTLVDIFAIKAISFWQAWGLIVLAQILFKANVRSGARTGRWQRRRFAMSGDALETEPQPPHGFEV